MDPGTVEIHDGETLWRFDTDFLASRWTCIWGRGCQGIGPEPAAHLGLGCCSIGADLGDEDEARNIAALAATLDPDRFERHTEAAEGGIFSDGSRTHTRVVDGACIFLNRPGFAGRRGLRAAPGGHRDERVTDRLETVGVLAAAHQGGLDGRC